MIFSVFYISLQVQVIQKVQSFQAFIQFYIFKENKGLLNF